MVVMRAQAQAVEQSHIHFEVPAWQWVWSGIGSLYSARVPYPAAQVVAAIERACGRRGVRVGVAVPAGITGSSLRMTAAAHGFHFLVTASRSGTVVAARGVRREVRDLVRGLLDELDFALLKGR